MEGEAPGTGGLRGVGKGGVGWGWHAAPDGKGEGIVQQHAAVHEVHQGAKGRLCNRIT